MSRFDKLRVMKAVSDIIICIIVNNRFLRRHVVEYICLKSLVVYGAILILKIDS